MDFITIGTVHRVFEGSMKPRYIERKPVGRYCDGLSYLVSGKVRYILPDRDITVSAGMMVHLCRGSIYHMDVLEPSEFICVDFDALPIEETRPITVFPILPSAKGDFQKMFRLWHMGADWQKAEAHSILCHIWARGLRSKTEPYHKTSNILTPVLEHLLSHYSEKDLSVEKLAALAGISPTHLRRLFHAQLHTSPAKYLGYLRLEKAKTMLAGSNCTVAEAADACGFEDPYYFSRFFKKEVGLSPTQYRKNAAG